MDWSKSYTASWRVFRVNRDTWADADALAKVDAAAVTRTADGDLIESGSMEVSGDFSKDYYRLVMTAEQGGEVARVDVATLLFIADSGTRDYGTDVKSVQGYSVLFPASTTAVLKGEYAPAGIDGAQYAARLLQDAINAPVEVEGSFTLNNNVVHEFGTDVLKAAWSVLDAGNFCIQIDGRGVVHIRPLPTNPALEITNNTIGLLMHGITYTSDTADIPNRYIAVSGAVRAIAENNSTTSEVSTSTRGYAVDEVDESPEPINGETLGEYAVRKLREMSVLREQHSYKREYAPGVNIYDIIRASVSELDGDMRIISQAISCDYGIVVDEKVEKEVQLWQ